MKSQHTVPLLKTDDVGGIVYSFVGNLVNYIIVIYALKGIGWSDELVYTRVIPGLSIGLMLSGLFYAYLGWKLSKKTGRSDVTALPSGVSTPAMFVYLYGIIYPLHYSGLAPRTMLVRRSGCPVPWWNHRDLGWIHRTVRTEDHSPGRDVGNHCRNRNGVDGNRRVV